MSLRPCPSMQSLLRRQADDRRAPLSELRVDNGKHSKLVEGAVLEAALEDDRGYLVFLTDDIPGEDGLSIHWLNRDLDLLDSAVLGAAYATGRFCLLPSRGGEALRFRFFGDCDWTIELLPAPGWRLPVLGVPRGVSRHPVFKRHFLVHGQPRPEIP